MAFRSPGCRIKLVSIGHAVLYFPLPENVSVHHNQECQQRGACSPAFSCGNSHFWWLIRATNSAHLDLRDFVTMTTFVVEHSYCVELCQVQDGQYFGRLSVPIVILIAWNQPLSHNFREPCFILIADRPVSMGGLSTEYSSGIGLPRSALNSTVTNSI